MFLPSMHNFNEFTLRNILDINFKKRDNLTVSFDSFTYFYFRSRGDVSLLVRVVAGAPPRAPPPTSPLASSEAAALTASRAASGGSQLTADPFRLTDCRH